ncbi:HXXEE domain-containing protein [Clostridium drakei]|uniref:HXXEE domain-containing protein n=1 Tax=Clostridium drakei TaxID=332101 RepID=A0A2U8DLH2_9CLOT|nr:HXXEE domain-containing protein [Clostridium drakei]AWI03577.1 HXXEE domain-containing protein [Clostridium drakei]
MENVEFISLIWLFPLIFMVHDFEEIIFQEWWFNKERLSLLKKYPKVVKEYEQISTAGFALAVSEEFIVLLIISLTAIVFRWYYLWLGTLVTFLIHLIIHIVQWAIYKKYIPAIITVIPAVIYSIYAIRFIYKSSNMMLLPGIMWSIGSMIIFLANLFFAHIMARRLTRSLEAKLN